MRGFFSFRHLLLLCLALIICQVLLFALYFNLIDLNTLPSVWYNNEVRQNKTGNLKQELISDKHHLPCVIRDKQAISALNRIQSFDCRHDCIETYCFLQKSPPWPKYLENKCGYFNKSEFGHLTDCYRCDESILDQFSSKKHKVTANLSREQCNHLCLQIDSQYALLHFSHCICTRNIDLLAYSSCSTITCDIKCLNSGNCPNNVYIYTTGLLKRPYYFPNLSVIKHTQPKARILFLLLVSGRAVFQVHRLLKNIYSNYHYYFIHVDKRHNYMFNELLQLEEKYLNIKLSRKRYASIWGGSSLLTTILSCFNESIRLWDDWDFVLNLSETDFPIKKLAQLEQYLAANLGKNFVKSHGKNTFDFIQTQALNKVFVECDQHLWRISNRDLIKGVVWDGGSDWFVLSKNFTNYLVTEQNELLAGFKRYFQYALLPAESFFHVVLRNSEYCSTVVNNNLKATNWNRRKGCKCQQRQVVDWCGCSPNVFRASDASRLISTQTRPLFFARKFEHVVDSYIIHYVERRFITDQGGSLLEGSYEQFYPHNTFHHAHDGPLDPVILHLYNSLASEAWNWLRLNCDQQVDTTLFLLQSNVLFKNSKFDVTHLKYRYFNNDTFEFVIKQKESGLIFPSSTSSLKLKQIKVCSSYDVKEEIFRNFECIFGQTVTTVQILHVWDSFKGIHTANFLFLNPSNQITFSRQVFLNQTDSTDLKLVHELPHGLFQEQGIWKVVILLQNDVLGVYRFEILSKNPASSGYDLNSEQILPAIADKINLVVANNNAFFNETQLWVVSEVCHNQNVACQVDYGQCDQVPWSSHSLTVGYM